MIINGIDWSSKKHYDDAIINAFNSLDKNDNSVDHKVEAIRSFYGIRKKDLHLYYKK